VLVKVLKWQAKMLMGPKVLKKCQFTVVFYGGIVCMCTVYESCTPVRQMIILHWLIQSL